MTTWIGGLLWAPATSGELRPLMEGHYSRRHTLRRGARFGGIGDPCLLASVAGSALIATWQGSQGWDVAWRVFPSWWLGAFRRHPDDAKASELIAEAFDWLQERHQGAVYTTVNLSKVKSSTPGLVFLRAGFRYHCSTRPLARCRSQLVLVRNP